MEPEPYKPRRFRFIGCEIVFREACLLAAHSRNIVDLEFVRKGLHDVPRQRMQEELQRRIDAVDPATYEAVLLGYGRCNDGTVGLQARAIPLVIPRAHDCITLFLGSKQRYRDYFDAHPGTYFRTSGWIERNFAGHEGTIMQQLGLDKTFEDYVKEYGRENAEMIMQFVNSWQRNYRRLTFIDTVVASRLGYDQRTRQEAEERGWEFEKLPGDLGLLARMLHGQWDAAEFVVVPPGQRIVARNEDVLILDCTPEPVSRIGQEKHQAAG
jgi:hypothetical protein